MICAAPVEPTVTAAGHAVSHSCICAAVIGAGAPVGLRHASAMTLDPPPFGVAVNETGGGGPLLSTTTVGDVTTWLLPAASVATSENVCGPSATRRVSTLSEPAGCCGHGCASVKSHACGTEISVAPLSLRTSCSWMPVASLAVNVTGTTPDTTPEPHNGPATSARVGAELSVSVTRAE